MEAGFISPESFPKVKPSARQDAAPRHIKKPDFNLFFISIA
jgi:hypothetical protein